MKSDYTSTGRILVIALFSAFLFSCYTSEELAAINQERMERRETIRQQQLTEKFTELESRCDEIGIQRSNESRSNCLMQLAVSEEQKAITDKHVASMLVARSEDSDQRLQAIQQHCDFFGFTEQSNEFADCMLQLEVAFQAKSSEAARYLEFTDVVESSGGWVDAAAAYYIYKELED